MYICKEDMIYSPIKFVAHFISSNPIFKVNHGILHVNISQGLNIGNTLIIMPKWYCRTNMYNDDYQSYMI